MSQVFVITEHNDLARSLSNFLRFKQGAQVKSMRLPRRPHGSDPVEKLQWVPRTFSQMAGWLESEVGHGSSGHSLVLNALAIVEVPSLTSLDELNPIDRSKDWSAVVAMLFLAFPEVHWVLISPYRPEVSLLRKAHFSHPETLYEDLAAILQLRNGGFSTLFDAGGLREVIRCRLTGKPDTGYVPVREKCAISIDDEESYAYSNAYISYRFGFRCHVVTSYEMMSAVVGLPEDAEIALSFEDVFLNFPDKQTSLSNVRARDTVFPALKKIPKRIFVTSGHEGESWQANKEYLIDRWREGIDPAWKKRFRLTWKHQNPPTNQYAWILYKPESGVFDVWKRSGLREQFKANDGKAEGFIWPPQIDQLSLQRSSHSSPGRLLLIANSMIGRAERIAKSAVSVPEAVHGAVLALEAQEYLGYRTPTTSLDAVALKHQLEVLAECMFYGVEYHLDTRSRFKEIKREIQSIGTWFRTKTQEISKLNAEMGILSDLVRSYRSFNQFDEEQAGLSKLRHLYRRLWFKRNRKWIWCQPFRWYVDQLLSSAVIFGLAIVGWIFVFAVAYACIQHEPEKVHYESRVAHGFEDAIVAFFGLQPPHDLNGLEGFGWVIVWLTMVVIVMSFVHLGIFVSHLYSLMARR